MQFVIFSSHHSSNLLILSQDKHGSSHAEVPASWASWNFSHKYLPAEFFTDSDHPDSFKSFVSWIATQPWINPSSGKLHCTSSIEKILLGLGLALRAYAQAHFIQDDDIPSDFPDYTRQTTLVGYNSIMSAIEVVLEDIERLNN
jgi:hypothetical protein